MYVHISYVPRVYIKRRSLSIRAKKFTLFARLDRGFVMSSSQRDYFASLEGGDDDIGDRRSDKTRKKNNDEVFLMTLDEEKEEEEEEEAGEQSTVPAYSLTDLLIEMWLPAYPILKNLRLIVSFINHFLVTSNENKRTRQVPTDQRRRSEGVRMKLILSEFLDYCGGQPTSANPTSSVSDLLDHINKYRSFRSTNVFDADDNDPFSTRVTFTQRTYYEWLDEYKDYTKRNTDRATSAKGLCLAPLRTTTATALSKSICATEKELAISSDADTDELFDSSIFEKKDEEENRVQQYMTREKDGTLVTWKTPGETGTKLIRLDVFNVKDIAAKDKRNWWKYARVRSQFLSSTPRSNHLLHEILNEAATGMTKVPGILKDEKKMFF